MPTASAAGRDPSSHQMPEIMRVMDEIAFQANIMALQTAVEAAKAGQAGSREQ